MKTKEPKVGDVLAATSFRNRFGLQAVNVLSKCTPPFIVGEPKKRGGYRKFTIVVALPSKEEFERLRTAKYQTTINELIEDAVSELECLRDELQEWYDNLPDSFQQSEKGDEIQNAIDAFESVQNQDVPKSVAALPIVFIPVESMPSRSDRRDNAAAMLRDVIDYLQNWVEASENTEENATVEDLIAELGTMADDAEGVEFPRAFG